MTDEEAIDKMRDVLYALEMTGGNLKGLWSGSLMRKNALDALDVLDKVAEDAWKYRELSK